MRPISDYIRLARSRLSLFLKLYRRYPTLSAWSLGERLPADWLAYPDRALQATWFAEYVSLKGHLWRLHIATLTDGERQALQDGSHPSLTWDKTEEALPIAQMLTEELRDRGFNAEVRLGSYHGEQTVMSVKLDRAPKPDWTDLPELYKGYQVKYGYPTDAT